MQYEVATPADYLAALDHDWRRVALLTLRATVRELAPAWTESIGHGMLCYSDGRGPVLHLSVQKNYVSLYVGDLDTLDPDGSLTAGLSRGKGCLRFTKSKDVAGANVRRLVERVIARREAGDSRAC